MRTGNYRFTQQYTQNRWFSPPAPVQVLMVEVDEPVDASGTRARRWRPATPNDVADYEARQRSRETVFQETAHERNRLRDRLDDMAGVLQGLASRATLL